jgi:hypothetical protein
MGLISGRRSRIIRSMRTAAVLWRAALCVAIAGGAIACVAANWHSPVRVTLAVLTLLLVPGEGVALALAIRDPLIELTTAIAASLALGSIVSLVLLYVHSWSLGLCVGILCGIAVAGIVIGLINARNPRQQPAEVNAG